MSNTKYIKDKLRNQIKWENLNFGLIKKSEWRWNLKARNGKIIAVSEGYTTKQAAKRGITSVRFNAPFARIINLMKK